MLRTRGYPAIDFVESGWGRDLVKQSAFSGMKFKNSQIDDTSGNAMIETLCQPRRVRFAR